jgi:glycosyltransferase involved in cell wall biosynthesis
VIAYGTGGALDTVHDSVTGFFFERQTVDALSGALARFERHHFDHDVIRTHASQFSAGNFRRRIGEIVTSTYEAKRAQWQTIPLPGSI